MATMRFVLTVHVHAYQDSLQMEVTACVSLSQCFMSNIFKNTSRQMSSKSVLNFHELLVYFFVNAHRKKFKV